MSVGGSGAPSTRSRAAVAPGLCAGSTGGSAALGSDVLGVIWYGHRIPAVGTRRGGRERSGLSEVFVIQWLANQLPVPAPGTAPALYRRASRTWRGSWRNRWSSFRQYSPFLRSRSQHRSVRRG